jgi:hypothetical protein
MQPVIITLLFALMLTLPIAAVQKPCGGIEGRITSVEGVLIPRTSIRITNRSTKQTTTVESDADARYTICLAPGRYDLQATALGYKSVRRKSIDVDATSKAMVDFVLKHDKSGWVDREHP